MDEGFHDSRARYVDVSSSARVLVRLPSSMAMHARWATSTRLRIDLDGLSRGASKCRPTTRTARRTGPESPPVRPVGR